MAVVFLIPGPLRPFTNGANRVVVDGSFATLGEAVSVLCALHPGLRDRILTDQGEIREHVNLFVGQECVRYGKGLGTEMREGAEVSVIPAITGGNAGRRVGVITMDLP
jgi:sulfur-carrier protein